MSHALADFLAAAEAIVARHDFSPAHEIGRRGWLIDATSGRPRFSRCIEFANPTGRLARHMTFIIEFGDAPDAYSVIEEADWRRRPVPAAPPAADTTTYLSPTGAKIVGTLEDVPALALIDGITPQGSPVYSGTSDVWWDDGQTRERHGRILYVDDAFERWTFDQLTPTPVLQA